MANNFKDYKKCTEPIKIVPESVQDFVPCEAFSESGIFKVTDRKDFNVFDKVYGFADVNYNLKDDERKEEDLERWLDILRTLQASAKIIVTNTARDIEVVKKEEELVPISNSPIHEVMAGGYNKHISKLQAQGTIGIEQNKYILVSCVKATFDEAIIYFENLENSIVQFFSALETKLEPLDAINRFKVFHSMYRPGEETKFNLTWNKIKLGRDFRNDVVPYEMHEEPRAIDFGTYKGAVLHATGLPEGLRDGFISRLTSQLPFPLVCTIDISPIPKEVTRSQLKKVLVNTEGAIDRQQQRNNKRGAFTTLAARDKRKENEALNEDLDEVDENDQRMFYTSIMVYVIGADQAELDSRVERIIQAGQSDEVTFSIYFNRQLDALMTVLPTATRRVNVMRPIFTDSLAAICPFNVSDVNQEDGFVYGINNRSKNIVRLNRTTLKNGNAFIYAPSGSGKSFFVKNEIGQILLLTDDDVLILDPANEYGDICELWGGQYINFTMKTEHHINPLQVPGEVFDDVSLRNEFVGEKCEFMQNLFLHVNKGELSGTQSAIVDRCTRNLYLSVFERFDSEGIADEPTFVEYRPLLKEESLNADTNKKVALELYDAMDLYVNGSLDIFAHKSNIDIDARFTCFGIRDLGKSLRKPAMLMIMEIMSTKLEYNRDNKKATWVFGDEMHVVLDEEDSSKQWDRVWRMARKDGGMATGITQNISDSGTSRFARNMMQNSEMLIILSLSKSDRKILPDIVDVSSAEIEYLRNQPIGVGLLKYGGTNIVFDGRMSKENLLYWLYTTDPKEAAEKEKVIAKLKDRMNSIEERKVLEQELEAKENETLVKGLLDMIDEYEPNNDEPEEVTDEKGIIMESAAMSAATISMASVENQGTDITEGEATNAVAEEEPVTNEESEGDVVSEEQLFCPGCGHKVFDSWTFCKLCGTALKVNCTMCGAPVPEGATSCSVCESIE
ncbi:hypothetical protein M2145_002552 [Lachnospiraceae bacterium PF1-21]